MVEAVVGVVWLYLWWEWCGCDSGGSGVVVTRLWERCGCDCGRSSVVVTVAGVVWL